MKNITLNIITQEKELLKMDVELVSVPTVTGEITVLPNHIPLFTKLQTGELKYKKDGQYASVVILNGFLDVSPDSVVTVLTDTATLERDITVAQAEEARKKAEEAMKTKLDRRQTMIAEASLKKALLELNLARKRQSPGSNIPR